LVQIENDHKWLVAFINDFERTYCNYGQQNVVNECNEDG
jgi:hypothetical protein